MRWKSDQVHAHNNSVTRETNVQECDSLKSLCNLTHSSSAWANFAPKLTGTSTATEAKNPVTAHVAVLRRVVTDPLEHGDATGQHDHGVQILADVSRAQLSLNRLSTRGWGDQVSSLLEPGHQNRRTASCHSSRRKGLSICCTMLTSVTKLTVAPSSATTTNQELCAGHEPVRQKNRRVKNCKLSMTICLCQNGPQDGEACDFELPLLAPWHLLKSNSLERQCTPWMSQVF